MPTFVPREELLAMARQEREPTAWFEVDQQRIDLFAEATGDFQFIHVDPEKAKHTPFGTTIAHGYLTLSLLPKLSEEVAVAPEGMLMAFNYGLDKLRFPHPVKAGSEIRLRSKILEVKEKGPGRILLKTGATLEIRGEEKPGLVAETLTMYVLSA